MDLNNFLLTLTFNSRLKTFIRFFISIRCYGIKLLNLFKMKLNKMINLEVLFFRIERSKQRDGKPTSDQVSLILFLYFHRFQVYIFSYYLPS